MLLRRSHPSRPKAEPYNHTAAGIGIGVVEMAAMASITIPGTKSVTEPANETASFGKSGPGPATFGKVVAFT
jgi:hypothetical protein